MPHRVNPQTLRRLTYFAAIADAGSIREAARRLGLSVASVSEALAALEDELSVTLAVRNTRRLHLTEEGRRVESIAMQVIDAAATLFPNVKNPGDVAGHVAVTASVEIAHSWLPSKIERLKRDYPNVGVTLSASDHLVDLSQSTFDIAVRALFVPPGGTRTGEHELSLACVSANPLPLEPRSYGWFAPVPLLAHRTPDHLDFWDTDTGKPQQIRFAEVTLVDNKHVALAMVARHMGAALVVESSLETTPDLWKAPDTFDFGHLKLEFEMRDKRPSPAANALRDVLLSNATAS